MSGERREPELLNLVGAEDPRDVIHRVVACLAQGGVAILPTETNYVLAAGAGHASAVERLRAAKGKGPDRPLTLGLRGACEISDWVPNASLRDGNHPVDI